MIFGFALEELLAADQPDLRVAWGEDSGARGADTGFEGAFGAGLFALRVQLFGFLAEVPDVALTILGVESLVTSSGLPLTETTSCTTVVATPRIFLVLCVAVTVSVVSIPSFRPL